MGLVTKRDMEDAKALAERAGIESMDDFDAFLHDLAQSIADGRRRDGGESLLDQLVTIAMAVLHHDVSEGSDVDIYERGLLRQKFLRALG